MNLDSRASRWITAVLLVAAATAAAAPFALSELTESAADQSARWEFDVTVDKSDPMLACPPGIADPLEPQRLLARPTVWTSSRMDQTRLDGGGTLVLPGHLAAEGPVPLVFSTAGLIEGEGRSLLVTGCAAPVRQLALVGGSTIVGEDALLTIVNPGSQATHVSIEAFGAGGPLGQLPQPLTIPARSTTTWIPASWFPDVDRLALVLSTDSGGVAAWMQSSGRDGAVPLGMAQLASRPLSNEAVFPGLSESAGTPVLRLVNPGEDELPIQVGTTSENGIASLPGTEDLKVAPGAVFEISLSGIGADPTAVVVSATEPFSASVAYQIRGEADPLVPDQLVEARTLVSAASSFSRVEVPSGAEIADFALSHGFTDVEVSLTIANPGEVPVTVAGEVVAPGGSRTWTGSEIDQLGGSLIAGDEVYGALSIGAQTELGPVLAMTDLGAGGMATGTTTVFLGP